MFVSELSWNPDCQATQKKLTLTEYQAVSPVHKGQSDNSEQHVSPR